MEWRKVRSEELNDLYSSPKIIRVIKSRRIGWARHVAPIQESKPEFKTSMIPSFVEDILLCYGTERQ